MIYLDHNLIDLVIETDIGHDPDDFFAITYLIAAGVNLQAVLITPGDPDQIAITRLILDECGLDIPVGVSKLDRPKLSSGSIHHKLLKKYNRDLCSKSDGLGKNILKDVIGYDTELFICGPVSSIGQFLKENPDRIIKRATMQGGFCPYSVMTPDIILDKFKGKEWVGTFNLNGDRNGAKYFLNSNIERYMVGKNICHTVEFDREKLKLFSQPRNRAAELFMEGAKLYFQKHQSKKFHDPTAAVCCLHPEIGAWICGKTIKMESGWTTKIQPDADLILYNFIDRNMLWEHLTNWN